jgi:hypothetical protein
VAGRHARGRCRATGAVGTGQRRSDGDKAATVRSERPGAAAGDRAHTVSFDQWLQALLGAGPDCGGGPGPVSSSNDFLNNQILFK